MTQSEIKMTYSVRRLAAPSGLKWALPEMPYPLRPNIFGRQCVIVPCGLQIQGQLAFSLALLWRGNFGHAQSTRFCVILSRSPLAEFIQVRS